MEIKQRELGRHQVDTDLVDAFGEESNLLALIKAIDLEGGDVLTPEGLSWGDGIITYDIAIQALRRNHSREQSAYALTQNYVTGLQTLGEDQRDYIKRVE